MCDKISLHNQKERETIRNCFTKCDVTPPKFMFLGLFKNCDAWIADLKNDNSR